MFFQQFEHHALSVGNSLSAIAGSELCKLLSDEVAAQVAGHDDDGVLEIDGAPLVVGEATIVEHLQQGVEHIGVGFFNLVKQHHRVGFASHSLGELSALVIAHIAGRRANEASHAELLLIFAHVDASNHVFVVKQVVGKSFGKLGLAHARCAHKDK